MYWRDKNAHPGEVLDFQDSGGGFDKGVGVDTPVGAMAM